MSIPNRAAVLTKLHRGLKKQFSPVPPAANRSVFEALMFACLLEDSHHEAAEKSYSTLVNSFFDWNEIRVSSVKELAEVTSGLFDAEAAARRLKQTLHGVFEATYQFDLEDMKKQNIGAAEKRLEKFSSTSPFVVAYVVQHALGGHSIPLDKGSLQALYVVGAATESEAAEGKVPGLERAIAKKHGAEFGSLLHQLGAEVTAGPYSPKTRKTLLDLAPDCKDRLPKRQAKAKPDEEPPQTPEPKAADAAPSKKSPEKPSIKVADTPPAPKKAPPQKPAVKKPAAKKPVAKKPAVKKIVKKPSAKKHTAKKTAATRRIAKRKPR
jgi:endonuclease-3